jgi:hypothetical protein
MKQIATAICALVLTPSAALADTLTVHAVARGVWAIEGPATQRDPENLGNNATFGLIETGRARCWSIQVAPGKARRHSMRSWTT